MDKNTGDKVEKDNKRKKKHTEFEKIMSCNQSS